MFASAPMMTGHLPPSSSVTGVKFSAAALATSLPTVVEPVKTMWSNGSAQNAAATDAPPLHTCATVSSYAALTSLPRIAAVAGAYSLGLIMTELPAANADASGPMTSMTG